ncbi:MAG: hypothetical protein ACYSOW_03755 [Planctomycetota bacterium]
MNTNYSTMKSMKKASRSAKADIAATCGCLFALKRLECSTRASVLPSTSDQPGCAGGDCHDTSLYHRYSFLYCPYRAFL